MKVNILNAEIDKINYKQALQKIGGFINDNKQHYIVTPNPEIVLKAMKDEYYRAVINNADLSLPDGFGLILGSWFLGDPIYKRVTGVDLTYKIAKLAKEKNYKIFLLGGKNNATKIAKTKLELKFRNIKIVGIEEGFKDITNPTKKENQEIINKINKSQAQILLIAYGAPFQEKWIYENLKKIPSVKLAMGIGGTIDFIAGKSIRAPILLRKIGLEWLWRLFTEPFRLNRIFNATIVFSFNLIKWKIHILKPFRKNVAGVIINNENKVLIVNRKNNPKHWQFPQGGINKNETPEQAVLRELKEETGLNKLKILGRADKIHKYYWSPFISKTKWNNKYCGQEQVIFFLKQTESKTPNPKEEHQDYKWIDKNEIIHTIAPIRISQTKLILKHIDQYINK